MADYDDPRPSSQPTGSTEGAVGKDNLITLDRIMTAPTGTEITNRKGKSITPIVDIIDGAENVVQAAVDAVASDTIQNTADIAELKAKNSVTVSDSAIELTQTGAELQAILDDSASVLKAVAISAGTTVENVMFATNTTDAIVGYIYDADEQVTYSVPDDAQGKNIQGVVDGVLTTSDSIDYGLNEFVDDNSYNFQPSQAVSPKVFQPQKSMFAFHYDGPYITNFTDLLDKADELGVPVCIGAIKNLTNGASGGQNENPLYGYVTDYIDAQSKGHEIYNHGHSSTADMSPGSTPTESELELWVNDSHDWLQSLGINAQMWVTSNGLPVSDQTEHLDPAYIPLILERHSVAFGRTSSITNDVDGYAGVSYGADTLVNQVGLTRANIEGHTVEQVKDFIDYCVNNGRSAVFHNHDSGNTGHTPPDVLEELVNYIRSRGSEVVKSQELFASFTNIFSDEGTSSKCANSTVANGHVVNENLLPTSQLEDWDANKADGLGAMSITNWGYGRECGSQHTLSFSNPTILNKGTDLILTIDRPFNSSDAQAMTFSISYSVSSSDDGDFGLELAMLYYDSSNTLIHKESKGRVLCNGESRLELNTSNLFSYSNVSYVKVRIQIANKTIWTGSKNLLLFNATLNRGVMPASHKSKITGELWSGQKAEIGSITLPRAVNDGGVVTIKVGANNANKDYRGSETFAYNNYDRRTIRAWSNDTTYTDFVVKFNSTTELEILSETVTGGGDFAVLGVYQYD